MGFLSRLKGLRGREAAKPRPLIPVGTGLRYLNLGCGRRFHAEWINADLVPAAPEVHPIDLGHALPFGDRALAVVYHSHVLEHLSRRQGAALLQECFRILEPGGIVRVVVPDLEGIARGYLEQLADAAAGEPGAQERHEWMTLELLDQIAREEPGGEMLRFWRRQPLPEEEFVVSRMGEELRSVLPQVRNAPPARQRSEPRTSQEVAAFRARGEVHRWMYDRVSLARLLAASGFVEARVCGPVDSSIPDFARFQLDAEADGHPRKPDSLFMEAKRPAL